MAEAMELMDQAAEAAKLELAEMLKKMTPEERAGAAKVSDWMRRNYQTAGYKRLSKSLLAVTLQKPLV